jgi:release factor glutamine methyltransferase
VSRQALDVAALNAQKLRAKVKTIESDLLEAFLLDQQSTLDIIMANLPYVDRSWPTSPELQHEPQNALFTDDNGLELIKRLIAQSNRVLQSHGYLILEADPSQFSEIIIFSKGYGLAERARDGYCLILEKA